MFGSATIDKKSRADEASVSLCNYMDVFHNSRITSNISFMKATASAAQIRDNALRQNDVVFTKDLKPQGILLKPHLSQKTFQISSAGITWRLLGHVRDRARALHCAGYASRDNASPIRSSLKWCCPLRPNPRRDRASRVVSAFASRSGTDC